MTSELQAHTSARILEWAAEIERTIRDHVFARDKAAEHAVWERQDRILREMRFEALCLHDPADDADPAAESAEALERFEYHLATGAIR